MTGKILGPLISSIRASLWASLLFFPTALFALGLGDIRLKSALNEPLDAEIELLSATPDELASLRASLASRETFIRYGLERPQFLANLDFRVGRSGDGRNVLFVRSRESVTEPFLTFLIEVNWSRGRLLREYTVLMDPPVYMPGEETASAPVSAPQTSAEQPSSGRVERPVEAPVQSAPPPPPPAPAVSRPSAPISADAGSYTVRQNDTLWQIASGLRPGSRSDVNRMMIALFQANPEAFVGNINRLKSGAILRIPSDTEFDALAASDAAAEVRRQTAEWRETRGLTAAAGTGEEARLRLVTPTEGGEGAGVTTPSASEPEPSQPTTAAQPGTQPAPGQAGRVPVQDPELARLQEQQQAPAATAEPPAAEQPAEAPATAPEAAAPGTEGTPAEEPAATEPPVTAEPAPAKPVPAAETEGPGFFERLPENWWLFLIGGLVLIGGAVVFFSMRRKEPDVGALGRLARAEEAVREMDLDREPRMPATGTTASMRAPKIKEDAFLVEESGEHEMPRAVRTSEMPRMEPPPPVRGEPRPSKADQTLSSETAINLDQGDPLAEADFHMAYGLYDQAADLVRIAIEREPQRRDLKLKLLEIFFVWGNKDAFLQTARQLHDSRGQASAGEWDKIAIMGRQIAPEDALFTGAAAGGGRAVADVDLNLEGGENRVDLDLLGPPEGEAGGGIDLDLGGVLGSEREEDTAITGESPALKEDEGLDFVLDDDDDARRAADSATTREMAARTQETPTIETTYRGGDAPTVESPTLRGSSTIKEKIDSALFRKETPSDQTAELALDDLGLDLDDLRSAHDSALEDDQDRPQDEATMVAGLDEKSRRLIAEAESRHGGTDDPSQSPTGTWVMDDKTLAATMALPGADTSDTARMRNAQAAKNDTARRKKLDADSTAELARLSADDMDLDLDRLEQALKGDTAKQQRKGAAEEDRFSSDVFGGRDHDSTDIDVDVGDIRNRNRDRAPTATSRIPADEMSLPELEPVTMSEVGTKLDLARAYMDMGDPEGARSILDEVLQEGSATQKQEAQRLIDSLPG